MKIYLRKVLDHDVTHEVSITKDVHADFFDNSSDLEFCKKTEKTRKYKVTVNNATDRRFGGEFKSLLRDLGDISTNDIIVIFKLSNGYSVDLIKQNDSKYETLSNMFSYTQEARHIIIDTDSIEKATNLLDEKINKFKRNRIVFGAPGTGKSFKLNNEKKELVGDNEDQYERVTFYPDYTYANFVGTYKPVMIVNDSNPNISENDKKIIDILKTPHLNAQDKYDRIDEMNIVDTKGELNYLVSLCTEDGDEFKQRKEDGTQQQRTAESNVCRKIKKYFQLIDESSNDSIISYEYVPGPFMRLFVKALKNPDKPYLLLIEEINRANVAAVFGDLFQLLDRDDNEESMYPVEASEDIKKFLLKEGIKLENNKIKIPSNLFIWATMNSADQGVFPMDTAFKRRWDFDYIGINNNEKDIDDIKFEIKTSNKYNYEDTSYLYWNKLRKSINKYLSDNKINEDKQLGPYFISKKVLLSNDNKEFMNTFKNKVIMYLFEDAAKQKRIDLFSGVMNRANEGYDVNSYSSICECFDKYGIEIFNNLIQNYYGRRIGTKEKGTD